MPLFSRLGTALARSGKGRPLSGLTPSSVENWMAMRLLDGPSVESIELFVLASDESTSTRVPPFLPTASIVLYLPPTGRPFGPSPAPAAGVPAGAADGATLGAALALANGAALAPPGAADGAMDAAADGAAEAGATLGAALGAVEAAGAVVGV